MTRLEAKALVAAGEPMGMAPERGERGVEYDLRGFGRLCRWLPSALQLVYLAERGAIQARSRGARPAPFLRLRQPGPDRDRAGWLITPPAG